MMHADDPLGTSKLPDVGTTIFTVMSKLAADHNAINLSQGYPDFPVPTALVDKLDEYTRRGENQYPPMHGIPYLREQIALKTRRCYGETVNPETEITVTSGATEALFVAIHAIVDRDDEVIVFDPAYDAYDPAIRLAGGIVRHLPLQGPDFAIDPDRLRGAVNQKTRAIIVNSPHNPTGAVISREDLDLLASVTDGTRILVISDEVYEHMVFDGAGHQSLLTHPQLRMRGFVVSSFGKTVHATGWKVGYCIAPPALTREFRKVHQFVTFTTHTPTQWALADFLEHHPEHDQQLSGFYQRKRDLLISELADTGFSLSPSAGTYFQLLDYQGLSDQPDTAFVEYLTCEIGVAAIPVSVFYREPPDQQLIRLCFAKHDDTLKEAAARLRRRFP
ncbi:MAG: methionine aminotransferase [Proteobacteria bacterium]|nr:methionine aminotransferase [Pseudomonadota bacterium]